jgi:hypothetical protein
MAGIILANKKAVKPNANPLKQKKKWKKRVLTPDAKFRYKDVHVVIMDFKTSKIDMDIQRSGLESVLKGSYLFGITKLDVPKWKTGDCTQLIEKCIEKIQKEYGHPDNLLIFIYNGHGVLVDGQLALASG